MAFEELNLSPGTWLAVNCASLPSENNCRLLMAAPEDQREDLIDAAAAHAADQHGHNNDEQLRADVTGLIETIEVRPVHA